jgi:hypothetical protein
VRGTLSTHRGTLSTHRPYSGLKHSARTHLQRARVVAGGVAVADPPLQRAELGHLREYSEYAEGTHSTPGGPIAARGTFARGSALCFPLHVVRCRLPVVCCPLHVVCCMLSVVRCMLHVVRCMSSVACCPLPVVRCLLHVVRRTLSVGGHPARLPWEKNRRVAARGNVACCLRPALHTEALHRTACRLALPHGLRCGRTSPTARIAASASSALQPTAACRQLPQSEGSGFRKFPRSGDSGFGRFRIRQFPDFGGFRVRKVPDSEGLDFGRIRIWEFSLSEISDFGSFRFRKFPHRQWRARLKSCLVGRRVGTGVVCDGSCGRRCFAAAVRIASASHSRANAPRSAPSAAAARHGCARIRSAKTVPENPKRGAVTANKRE